MNRRALLTALSSTVVAGCSGRLPWRDRGVPGDPEHPSVRVAGVWTFPGARVGAEVNVDAGFTDDGPAAVEVRVTNLATAPRSFVTAHVAPLPPSVASARNSGANCFVLPLDEGAYTDPADGKGTLPVVPDDGCWRSPRADVTVFMMAVGDELAPGESLSHRYALLADPANDGCLPAGDYRVDAELTVDGERLPWSFTLAFE